ncbi:MAG TPA: TraR/DksA C4-type zinc finger protein [Acidimicrobiales bacterium]|nr:TraR/DksA C4-type zinc finger protein [Acidimicrobiales bacterium]
MATRAGAGKLKPPASTTSRTKAKAKAAVTSRGKAPAKNPSKVATKQALKKVAAPAATKRTSTKAPIQSKSPKKPPTAKRGDQASVDKFLDDQRALLFVERKNSERQAESLRAEAEQLAEEMEPGDTQFDEESGEGGTLNVERERDLALSAQAWAAVDEIDRALKKIDGGSYGICEQCGQPIPKARLKAMPHATLCVACKSGGLSRR